MSAAGAGLLAATLLGSAGAIAGVALPARSRTRVAGALTTAAGCAALVAAIDVLATGRGWSATFPSVLPLAGLRFALDPLGALFVAVVGGVGALSALYGIGYSGHGLDGRTVQGTFPLFVLALLLVPAAAGVGTFLVLWELMALTSLVLVLAEHREREEVRTAGQWYAVMTHLGLVTILLAFALLAARGGGDSFAALRAGAAHASPALRSAVFLLALVGFGSKAGVAPLHVWLPRAHPEAPSHVSALMSGAMVKLGIYGLLRVGWDLLGGGPRWWALLVLGLGALSALLGILQALVSSDLKRLLAYSTTENVGLILIGVGAAALFASTGNRPLASVAMAAALLHVVNHAAFKSVLFLGAGSVLRATGTRDLDHLGGLVRRMPVTTATFAVGALAIAALPPLNGFASEWLLLQSLVHSLPSTAVIVAVTMPVAVAAVALTSGLAAATFVKALGTGFLAQPRSPEASGASEAPPTMLVGLAVGALACPALAFGAARLGAPLGRAIALLPSIRAGRPLRAGGLTLGPAGIRGSLSPVLLAAALAAGLVAVLAGLRAIRSPRRRRVAENWGCGRAQQTARMEYTAMSFAEPLQRVFDDVLRPDLDVDVTHRTESRYYLDRIRYRAGFRDAVEARLYQPVLRVVEWWGQAARRLQSGSIHRYLAYGFAALVLVLVVAR